MGLLVTAVLALLLTMASQRHNGTETVDVWPFMAMLAGALWPHADILVWLVGTGPYLQARHALLWSLPLLPLYALLVATLLAAVNRVAIRRQMPLVLTGMLLTVCWGVVVYTDVAPLTLISGHRAGLGIVDPSDGIVLALGVLGLLMAMVFTPFNRDMARLTLGCIAVYVLASGGLAVQAYRYGDLYADTLRLDRTTVQVRAGQGSLFHWDVLVRERQGELHLGKLDLWPGENAERGSAGGYLPPDAAIWRVTTRMGDVALGREQAGQVRLAWYGLQGSALAPYAQNSMLDGLMPDPVQADRQCAVFADVFTLNQNNWPGQRFAVCPEGLRARLYWPVRGRMIDVLPLPLVRYAHS